MNRDASRGEDWPWIVWVDYGSEGWKPRGCETETDALLFIEGGNFGSPVVLTRRRRLLSEDEPEA